MTKKEFLNGLEEAMLEQMDISEAAPHIRYYQDYIENEVRNGRDEEEVISALQNPRLIAKNIIDNSKSANKYKSDLYTGKAEDRDYNYNRDSYYNKTTDNKRGQSISFSINGKPINSILLKIVLVATIVLALVLILVIVSGVMWLLTKFVLPVILVGGIIYLLITMIKKSW